MNRLIIVGTCLAVALLMAVQHGIFIIDMTSVHKNAGPLLDWLADHLGEAIILYYLSKIQKSSSR
jgi:hypothetical protein